MLLCAFSIMAGNAMLVSDFDEVLISDYITLYLNCRYINPKDASPAIGRAPKKAPTIGQKGNVIYLYGQFGGLTLDLLSGGTQVYSALVPAGADEIVLPDDLSGIYELQLNDGSFVYSCEVEF